MLSMYDSKETGLSFIVEENDCGNYDVIIMEGSIKTSTSFINLDSFELADKIASDLCHYHLLGYHSGYSSGYDYGYDYCKTFYN